MGEESHSIDLLRNNAKIIGGVLGAEAEFLKDKLADTYFLDRAELNLQDVTYRDIERLPLGKAIKR